MAGPAAGVFSGREKTQRRTDTQGGRCRGESQRGWPCEERGGDWTDAATRRGGLGHQEQRGLLGTLCFWTTSLQNCGECMYGVLSLPHTCDTLFWPCRKQSDLLDWGGGAGSWPHISVHVSIHASTAQMLVRGPSLLHAPARNALSTKDTYSLRQFEQLHKTTAPKQHR